MSAIKLATPPMTGILKYSENATKLLKRTAIWSLMIERSICLILKNKELWQKKK